MNHKFGALAILIMAASNLFALDITYQKDGNAIYQTDGKESFPALVPLEILDGKAGSRAIALGKPQVEQNNQTVSAFYSVSKPKMEVTSKWRKDGKYLRHTVEVKNLSGEQLFLLVRQNMGLPGKRFQYWNGRQNRKKVLRNYENNDLYNSFPMCCFYTDKVGYALGIEPMQIFNYIENGVKVKGESPRGYYGVKLVVDPKGSEKAEFVSFEFTPDYGYYNAVSDFQDASKGNFVINPEVDPRLTKGYKTGATHLFSEKFHNLPHSVREYNRRQYGTWVWGYAPFQAAGDWYGRDETIEKNLHTNPRRSPTNQEFIARRKYAIDSHEEYNLAYYFYLITFCDEKLMQARYPDCVITDKHTINKASPWVFGRSVDCRMWGWNNKFGDDTVKDIKKIAENLNISGFAFDCSAAPGIARQQPGVQTAPGRAWDKEGVYVREATAVAKWMDVVHSIRKGPYILGTVGNMAGGGMSLYYSAIRSDAFGSDASFSSAFNSLEEQEITRFMSGNKPAFFSANFDRDKYGTIMPWQEYSPEKIKDIYNALRDNMILFMFRYAYYPYAAGAWGCEKLVRYMPIGMEVINSGYQTIPAIRVSSNVWFSRYGKDLTTCFFIGNQTLKPKKTDISIDCKYLGNGDYVFSRLHGGELENKLDNRYTKLEKELARKEIFLIRAVMSFPAGSKGVTAKTSFKDDFTGGTAKVVFKADNPLSGKITFRVPEDCEPVEIRFNGRPVAQKTNGWDLPQCKDGTLEFVWRSSLFHLKAKDLFDFEFGKAGIRLSADADKFDKYAATALTEYFKFYDQVTGSKIGSPEILTGTAKKPVMILFAAGKPGVSLAADHSLVISAPSAKERFELTHKVMRILDQKYFYYGKIGEYSTEYTRDRATQEMRDKGGIGKGASWSGM